jgi:MoxR-like ATPase
MSTKISKMRTGDTYIVRAGEFKGLEARIINPETFPDTDYRRRKITVEIDGEQIYMLPRLLDVPSHIPAPVFNIPVTKPTYLPHPETGAPVLVPGNITDPDDPRLDPWRPDPSIVRKYISRTIPNGQSDTDFLLTFYEKRRNVMLVGDTQSGKTMLVQVLAVLAGQRRPSGKPLPVFTLSGSAGVTDFDLFGQPTAFTADNGAERLVWLPGVVDLATRCNGILYLDEVNMMGERVTSSLHSLCDHRRAFVNRQKAIRIEHNGTEIFMPEVVEADDMWIVGTINPGYKGAGSMNEAFTNRFDHIPWGYDEAVEKKLIPSAAVRLLGQALREARANRSIVTPVGTDALARVCEHVNEHGVETAMWMLTSMFTPQERPKVDTIILDRSIAMLLESELQAAQGISLS